MTTFYTRYPASGSGGGITSINANTNTAQTIAAGSGISVASVGGTTTISSSGAAAAITSLTGDVTGTGPGATATTIANLAVTNAKIANATIDLTAKVTGVLPVANGGTNSSTSLNNNRVIVSSGSKIVEASAITASRALISDANGIPIAATTTSTEIGYVNGVTSAIQTQINARICATQEISVSSNVTLTNRAIHFVDTSAARTLTFPAPSSGAYIALKDITGSQGPNFTTLVPSGGEKIEGVAANYYLTEPYGEAEFVSDGTDWWLYGPKQKEFAYNSSTDNADNTTSFAYGPAGAQFINVSAQRQKYVRFKNTILVSDTIMLQHTMDAGASWLPAGQYGAMSTYLNLGGVGIGIGISSINTTDYNVVYERYRLPGNSYGGAGVDWSGVAASSTYRWRLIKF